MFLIISPNEFFLSMHIPDGIASITVAYSLGVTGVFYLKRSRRGRGVGEIGKGLRARTRTWDALSTTALCQHAAHEAIGADKK